MDLIADWHDWCLTKGLKYDRVHDQSESLGDMLTVICAAGRATPRHDGLRWGVVIDRPQDLVIDHVNPRNSAEFGWTRSYFTPPDAMRVRFLDATNDYQEAERVIPWPGHTGDITLTEALEMPGKTDPDEIWRETRRRMYELIHRPDAFSVIQGGVSRVATRGDLVMGSFDVLENTQSAARVQVVTGDLVTLDEDMVIPEGYGMRFRIYADADDLIGTSLVRAIMATTEPTRSLRFVISGPVPDVGEVVHIGPIATESLALRVRGVEPAQDFAARLLLVAAAPQIDTLTDADLPPVWDGRVGAEVTDIAGPPATPQVLAVSAGTVQGGGSDTVEVLLAGGLGSAVLATTFEVDHRPVGGSVWTTIMVPVADGGTAITGYHLSDDIEIRGRAMTGIVASAYTAVITFDIATGTSTTPPTVPDGAVVVTGFVGSAEVAITAGPDTATASFQIYRVPTGGAVDRAVHAIGSPVASTPSMTVSVINTAAAGVYDYHVEARTVAGEAGPLAGPFTVTIT